MKYNRRLLYLVFLSLFIITMQSCDEDLNEMDKGSIKVIVKDNLVNEPPIPDISITVTPGNHENQTNENGMCIFELEPGDYYVDAEVCCIGPGYIQFHEPVTVVMDEITEIVLNGCSVCE